MEPARAASKVALLATEDIIGIGTIIIAILHKAHAALVVITQNDRGREAVLRGQAEVLHRHLFAHGVLGAILADAIEADCRHRRDPIERLAIIARHNLSHSTQRTTENNKSK